MDFGRAIRIGRIKSGVSQRELASLTELDASFVSMIESGKRVPSLGTLGAVAHALHMPLYMLALLASDQEELGGISPQEAGRQVEELLTIIASAEPEPEPEPEPNSS